MESLDLSSQFMKIPKIGSIFIDTYHMICLVIKGKHQITLLLSNYSVIIFFYKKENFLKIFF